jgi:hypothetical protein
MFNCGGIGHFASKCPYAKNSDSDEEEAPKKEKKYKKGNKKENKRNSSRKSFTQKKKVLHLMRMMKAIVTQKEYSLWPWKLKRNS